MSVGAADAWMTGAEAGVGRCLGMGVPARFGPSGGIASSFEGSARRIATAGSAPGPSGTVTTRVAGHFGQAIR